VQDDTREIDDLLAYWLGPATADGSIPRDRAALWFGGGAATDRDVRTRFGDALERACRGELPPWRATARGRLATVILLDQFSRNCFRGSARAFAQDAAALALARDAIARGDEQALTLLERVFLYLPFEHAEDLAAQDESVRRFTGLVGEAPPVARAAFEEFLRYAVDHRDCIARFGRFPQRNATLGRASIPEERAFLDQLAG
jgi:uncharacterized protein (DUF924 family)